MPSIYLAGKIARNDWRHEIISGLDGAWDSQCEAPWPTLHGAVFGLDYVGPYFADSCHGMAHGGSSHGCGEAYFPSPTHADVIRLCGGAIAKADIFFAWLDCWTAYGTLVEIGAACAANKRVIVASPPVRRAPPEVTKDFPGSHELHVSDDMWFAFASASEVIEAESPVEAVRKIADASMESLRAHAMEELCESPIEVAFWRAHQDVAYPELDNLVAQHPVLNGRYRLDFALPYNKVAIELDGYTYHSSKDAFVKDRARQRILEAAGWRVIRFAGSEVTADPAGCVRQAAAAVRSYHPVDPEQAAISLLEKTLGKRARP